MTRISRGYSLQASRLILGAFSLFLFTGCTGLFNGKLFKERAAEAPAPQDQAVDKSFFVEASGKPKTFLCAWAPEIGRGGFGEEYLIPFVNQAMHCNVEFEITENFLVAKMINPSFLNDRSRWKEMLKIPIVKHFYYERNKDAHGRETNEWIENASRSHWSARPKMTLDLAHIDIQNFSDDGVFGQHQTTSVEDIEWDQANNFLGFSLNTILHSPLLGSESDFQGRFRVNFLRFDHDPSFKKVPYHQENARYMNVLHVMGRRIEGIEPELYAAHWDVRRPTRVYISGAPKEQQSALVAAVYKWNRELVKVGALPEGQLAFAPVLKTLAHPFDLRYPSITWIEDRRISMNAPLGIGMAHADVRNGKILWGGVVLFGGMLQKYINAYAPVEGGSSAASAKSLSPFQSLAALFPTSLPSITALDPERGAANRTQMLQNMKVDHSAFLKQEVARLAGSTRPEDRARAEALAGQMQTLKAHDPALNQIVASLGSAITNESRKVSDYFKHTTTQNLLGSAGVQKAPGLADIANLNGHQELNAVFKESNADKRAAMMRSVKPTSSPFFVEEGWSIENKVGGWMASPAQKTRTYPEILDSVVTSLIVHEFGHFIGLGHQFKENIVPEEGTVPSRFVRELSAKATPEREFTNMTSVMGYQSGRTEMMTPAEEYVPGPHDNLVLHYLYKGEYAVFDKQKDDFAFVQVPESGKIPESTSVQTTGGGVQALRTAYFPQCNDYEASLGADPFCNRWDRGSKAEDIVNSYFELISDNLLSNLYSLVGGGGDSQYAEGRLWNLSLDTFSRVRLFYDEMRRRLRSEEHLKSSWDQLRNDKAALLEFSKACMQAEPTSPQQVRSPVLRQIFADRGMVDLCRANGLALKEFAFFLNLPDADYTRIDHNNRYVNGGYLAGDASRNFGHIFGSWYQLSNLPLKFSSLYTLTAANSYMIWGGYLVPNFYYDNEENRFLYRTLYPNEYTRLVSNTVQNNLRFAVTGKDSSTTMGRAVLATGAMLPWQRISSNDSARLPREFNEMLDDQTKFNYGMVAVLVEAIKPDGSSNVKPDHYKKFTASIYDFFTGKSSTARDVFLLPNGDVFVWANGMFIYPVTKLKFYESTKAYVIAYKVDYDEGPRDELVQDSLKRTLMEKHNEIAGVCVNGFAGNGLLNYFDTANEKFEGFTIPNGIELETGTEKTGLFYDSVAAEFAKYEAGANTHIPKSFPLQTMRRVCDEAVRGVGQISAAAAMTNGFWLGITADYVEK